MEDWAEIRRLRCSEGLSVRAISARLGVARRTVDVALAADKPPRYQRASPGSAVDAFEPEIRRLLKEFPTMPATVIAERIGWTRSASVLRARVAQLRPLYRGVDPADRTEYSAGELAQCDLWFPPVKIPLGSGQAGTPPVLVMTSGFSRFITARMIPSRTTGDLLAGMWSLLGSLGGCPRTLVWDGEAGIGQKRRLSAPVQSFAGTLGVKVIQVGPRDPEAKGIVERANGYFETSFLPGRAFESPADFNTQVRQWLPRANARLVRRIQARPEERIGIDRASMIELPPIAPGIGICTRVRLPRDYYVRVDSNDYSVHPEVIGHLVDVRADLASVTVTCGDRVVASHDRSWAARQTITDPAHKDAAARLRKEYRSISVRSAPDTEHPVALRALPDYDDLFGTHETAAS